MNGNRLLTGLLPVVLVAAAHAQPGAPAAMMPTADTPLILPAGRDQIRVSLVTDGLVGPWDIAFLPGSMDMLVTESPGTLRIVRDGRLLDAPVWQAPSPDSADVLHGLAIHPDFATNGLVYASYTKAGERGLTLAISRGALRRNRLVDVEEIFVADAWTAAPMATAGRMIFGPDGMLYVTVGDRDNLVLSADDDNSIRILAQYLGNHVGKTLRLTGDGRAPADNPFAGVPGVLPEIFSYGHRNGYGLAFHPETGALWEVEIGPLGGDEINILEAGGNYGWPLVSMGRNYTGTLVSEQPWYRAGMTNPRIFWVPAISPSGLLFYTGDQFPDWKNSIFVGSLSGQQVQRISLGQPVQAEQRQVLLAETHLRFRDLEQGPDGNIYVTAEIRYGSRNPDGAILAISPVK